MDLYVYYRYTIGIYTMDLYIYYRYTIGIYTMDLYMMVTGLRVLKAPWMKICVQTCLSL